MAKNLDKKMLHGFVQEVRGYLPQIRANLASFGTASKRDEVLEETYRFVHTIKGASAMVGLAVLSHMAYYVEGTFEEIMGGQVQLDQAMSTWILRTMDHIEGYLEGLLSDNVPEQAIVTDVVQSFRRLKGLPEAADAAAIAEVLAGKDEPLRTGPAMVSSRLVEPQDPLALLQGTSFPATNVAAANDVGAADGMPARRPVETLAQSVPQAPGAHTAAAPLPVPSVQPAASPRRDTPQLVDTGGELEALIASIDQEVAQTYSPPTPAAAAPGQPKPAAPLEMADRYVLFDLAGARYAVSVASVFEVGRVPNITPVPNVPAWMRGVINLRGEILSAIDFRAFLGVVETYPRDSSRMLVVKSAGDEVTTSLIVDRVVGIVQLPQTRLAPPPAPDGDRVAPYLTGVCQHQDHVLAIFNLENFLLSPEVCQFS